MDKPDSVQQPEQAPTQRVSSSSSSEITGGNLPIRCQTHGPLFKELDHGVQNQIKKLHQNLGHPDTRVLQLALKRYGWSDKDIQGCADFVCPVCLESKMPKVARPGDLHAPRDFNDLLSFDAAEWQSEKGYIPIFPLIEAFPTAWILGS